MAEIAFDDLAPQPIAPTSGGGERFQVGKLILVERPGGRWAVRDLTAHGPVRCYLGATGHWSDHGGAGPEWELAYWHDFDTAVLLATDDQRCLCCGAAYSRDLAQQRLLLPVNRGRGARRGLRRHRDPCVVRDAARVRVAQPARRSRGGPMSRREKTTSIRCAENGCRESQLFSYSSQREYADIHTALQRTPWKCTRHVNPEQVLRPDNTTTSHVLVASRVRSHGYERRVEQYEAAVARKSMWAEKPEEFLPGLYWLPEGGTSGSGFTYGPGFKAHAADFPEGARLVVTTQILLPEAAS